MKTTTLLLLASCALAACAGASGGSMNRPNSYQDLATQPREQDPHDYVSRTHGLDPAAANPRPANGQTCEIECASGRHCDASGPVPRCVPDDSPK